MKKRKRKLNLNRETLRVEKLIGRAVGGYQSMTCNETDMGVTSVCQQCGS